MKDRLRLTFNADRVTQPVVCQMAKKFDVVFSIRRANVEAQSGWLDLSLEGNEQEIERAIDWLVSEGVRVDPIEGDIIAG